MSAQPVAAEAASLIEKETTLIHSAFIDCGNGFQPRFTRSDKHLLIEVSNKNFCNFDTCHLTPET
ncbi:hypothetical protein D1BOALGB6SA_6381 [Olavius sp. associated proteobacterium Delta 1]|nr:hypothetical protein D1BOALGB6SA_6381 [Olavius sp. associated proteobacterium Delta 1]